MTSEPLYKVCTGNICSRYAEMVKQDMEDFTMPKYEYRGNLMELMQYKESLESCYRSAKDYTVMEITTDIAQEIRKQFAQEFQAYEDEKAALESRLRSMASQKESAYKDKAEKIRAAAKGTVAPLAAKHAELMEYKDKLRSTMEHYGITPGDIGISKDISKEEFEALLDTALMVCKTADGKTKQLINKLLVPLEDEDEKVSILYAVLLFVATWLFLPLFSVVYIFKMLKNTSTMYKDMDKLRIAESLMHSVDFDRFIPNDDKYIVPDYDDSDIVKMRQEEEERIEELNPQARLDAELKAYKTTEGIEYVSGRYEMYQQKAAELHQQVMLRLEDRIKTISKLVEDELSKQKKLGDYMNSSTVMDTKFVIGYQRDVIPVKKDFGLTNINFIGNYDDECMLDTVKSLFVNAFLSIRANGLEVTIFDEEYLGQAFAEFITPKTAPYISIESTNFNKVQEDMQKHAAENILSCKTDTILEFNRKSEELGMVTRQYYLYILMTGLGDKLHENKPLMEFLKYSANTGVIVWLIYPQNIPSCLNITPPIPVTNGTPVHYDFDLGSRAVSTFEYALEHNKRGALDYRKGYLLKYIPEDKWWTTPSTKAINIRYGLEDGDPAKAYTLAFDDKNVHCLLGGATGAGKSVTIDCTMQNMLHEYAPDEFQMIYIDMKNAEVAKYTKNGFSMIPHALIVAGTTDGEYCLSIFDWALDEMIRRLNVCKKYGVQKVEDLRKKFDDPSRDGYDPEVHIPRTLILIDEFQVMFDTSRIPAKIVDKISGRITSLVKLARAASMHLWFTSQEMTGTLSKNVLDNFSTRGALRCTKEISSTLIGNDAAGTIREKVGWMYSNDSAGQDKNANKLWRVPYAPIDDLMLGITELREKAEREGRLILRAPFFDEKEGRTVADFNEAYEKFPDFNNPYFIVLGERTIYSTRPTPLNFRFVIDDKENLFACAFERQDAMDLIGTFIDNIMKKDGQASMLINCADKDTSYLLNLEQYMPEGWEDFLSTGYEVNDILADLEDILAEREERDQSENKPLYIFLLMWEKKDGIGQNENYKLTEALGQLIKKLNGYDVHFIFIGREKGVPMSLVSLCNHRICAKVDEKTAVSIIDETSPFSFPGPNGDEACFGLYKYGSDMAKFKIYRHVLERKLESRQL